MSDNIVGIVVLYNPEDTLIRNIRSYIDEVEKLYLIDNSTTRLSGPILKFIAETAKIAYHSLNGNKGIARALNEGCRMAVQDGYEWVLTMDQDSVADDGMVSTLMHFAEQHPELNPGVIAAQPMLYPELVLFDAEYKVKSSAITSGSLVNLIAYQKAGGFEDRLFIDCVDHVFCLGVRHVGYTIIEVPHAILLHNLGKSQIRHFCGIRMVPTHHNALRRYYITRNRHYMCRRYQTEFPDFIREQNLDKWKDLIKVLLFEEDKLGKIKAMYKGWRDAKRGVFGNVEW